MWFFGVSHIAAFHLEHVENHGKPFPSGKKRSQVEFALSTEQQHSFNPNNSAIEDERVSGTTGYAPGALEATGNGKKLALKPEVVISQHWNDLATRFQRLHIRFRGRLVQWSPRQHCQTLINGRNWKIAILKPEVTGYSYFRFQGRYFVFNDIRGQQGKLPLLPLCRTWLKMWG